MCSSPLATDRAREWPFGAELAMSSMPTIDEGGMRMSYVRSSLVPRICQSWIGKHIFLCRETAAVVVVMMKEGCR